MHVTAKDKGTGKENTITIQEGSGLSEEEIDRMVKDAEAHAEEDKQRREEQETRNSAESMTYQTRNFLKENEDKVPEDVRTKVEKAADDVDEALKGDDLDAIKKAVDELSTQSQEAGKAIYEAAQAEQQSEASGEQQSGGDDDVVDAEVVDEDDKKDSDN